MQIEFHAGQLSLNDLRNIYKYAVKISLKSALDGVNAAVDCVQRIIDEDRTVYGINTGFGLLASTRIARHELELLQKSIVLSHAAGVGQALDDDTVRLMMVLKINSLARGYSGVRPIVLEYLTAFVNHNIYPIIPVQGSVGASGDLAPLAHMSLLLIGEGQARVGGELVSAVDALKSIGKTPLSLAAKEGLALLNGTQASTAYALKGLFLAEDLLLSACVTGALSVEAALGSRTPFDARIHAVRGQIGQIDVAQIYRQLLDGNSALYDAHLDQIKVQDPYCLRCQPQVMGAALTQIRHVASVLHTEANAVSDNPLVFFDDDEILSGGNFHAEPVAMVADNLALAISEIASISERRISLLMDSHMSRLPAFLVKNGGVNSGFMIAQVTAAALVSENKALAHPHSVDSIPTSANQEDHVSMAPAAGARLWKMAQNSLHVIAIEYLAACQGIDLRGDYQVAPTLQKAKDTLRARVAYYDKDRFFTPDIEAAADIITSGALADLANADMPSR